MKTDVEYLEFMWPMRHFLVSCGEMGREVNIITVSFCMPVSKAPPHLACAVGKDAHSARLIEESGEFAINVPEAKLEREVRYCGFHSGRDVDKFAETGLTPSPARRLKAPVIGECAAHMECVLRESLETGDKILFIGEVLESYADADLASGERELDFAMGDFPRKIYGGRFDG